MEHLAPPDQVQEVVAAVLASGCKPTVKAVCRVLVIDFGLRSSSETRALALAAVAVLGLRKPTDRTLGDMLKPGAHTAERVEAHRALHMKIRSTPEGRERARAANEKARSTPEGRERANAASMAGKRSSPLSKMIGSCRKNSARRGHGEFDEAHLRRLWGRALAGDTPWHGLLDFGAYGVAEETGSAGGPWAPSFDRLDNNRGYLAGNVAVVPNVLNRTCQRYHRRLVLDLVARAVQLRAVECCDEGDVKALRAARPHGNRLDVRLSGLSAHVFLSHPALVPHRTELMERTLDALYGAGRGVCPVTGLAFSAEPGHPCFPSWDLVDHRPCVQRRYASGRVVSTEGGRETPADMRLVCQFFNLGRCTFDDADWWRMADHVRKLVEAGVST